MQLGILDICVLVTFISAVIAIGVLMSRHEKDSEGYFLAGRGLSWWLIGFSLIAANISTEQFVGMSGQAADYLGLAIASYEWLAAITLVVVAFFFLPTFLRSGIYTIPEFLEYRYDRLARTLMSLFTMLIYVGVTISAVIYSGAKVIDTLFSGQQVAIVGLPPISIDIVSASWLIGILAGIYVVTGGLKACAWADLLQGSALIIGGAIVVVLAMNALDAADPVAVGLSAHSTAAGPVAKFLELNHGKLHMVLPTSDAYVPWTALAFGLWIPNFYYWGLNQYITQRTLGAHSLGEGQKGIVFSAAMKLLIPFIVVVPGIIAFNLYKGDMQQEAMANKDKNLHTLELFEKVKADPAAARAAFVFNPAFAELHDELARQIIAFNARVAGEAPPTELFADAAALTAANKAQLKKIEARNATLPSAQQVAVQKELIGYDFDSAFPLLIKRLIPEGLRGFMLAAILGAVMSSLASMLNAASTIFTMDLYRQYLHRGAAQITLVRVGRACVVLFVVVGCLISPVLGNPRFGGIFTYIQEFQGFISPGILGVFIFGLFVHRAPRICGIVGLLLSPVVYGALKLTLPEMAFLNRMGLTLVTLLAALTVLTMVRPLKQPVTLPVNTEIALESSRTAKICGAAVVLATLALYAIFW